MRVSGFSPAVLPGRSLTFVLLAVMISLGAPLALAAADSGWTSGVVEYVDDQTELKVLDAQGKAMDNVYLGMELLGGDSVVTGNTTVEIRLLPGGSLIKISPNTSFKINSLPTPKSGNNDFSLVKGKIRVLAQKTKTSSYTFRTPVAVAGVRGTEFGLEVDQSGKDLLMVREGLVEYTQTTTQTTVQVAASQVANAAEPVMTVKTLEAPVVEAFFIKEDIEALKKAEEKEKAQAQANKSLNSTAQTPSQEEIRKQQAAEEAARLEEIRKAGQMAMAAEARRQKERDDAAREASVAAAQAKAEAERLKIAYLDGMIFVEGGNFTLGDTQGGGRPNERPSKKVTVRSFYLGQTLVSVGDFKRFVKETGYRSTAELRRSSNTDENSFFASRQARSWKFPGFLTSNYDPVRCVSWYDAVAYCNWLSVSLGKTPAYSYPGKGTDVAAWPQGWNNSTHRLIEVNLDADGFRLPTEAEWEYAIKGGKAQAWKGKGSHPLGFSRVLRVSEWMQDVFQDYGGNYEEARMNHAIRGQLGVATGYLAGLSARDAYEPVYTADSLSFRICLPQR